MVEGRWLVLLVKRFLGIPSHVDGSAHLGIFLASSANINRLAQSLVDLPTILMPGSIKSLDHGYLAHVLCACLWLGYAWVGDHGVRNNQWGQRLLLYLIQCGNLNII